MKKRFFAALLALIMALVLLPGTALAATQTNVPYRKLGVAEVCPSATVVESTDSRWVSGWYVVSGAVTIGDRITISGDVHLILADGAVLTLSRGITLWDGNSLTVYGQSAGTGRLNAFDYSDSTNPCIGDDYFSCGTLTVYGGSVQAAGGNVGIGGRNGLGNRPATSGGTVTVYGGSLEARGGSGVGIGGGSGGSSASSGGDGGTVRVYGGTLTAYSQHSRAIGGGAGFPGSGAQGANTAVTVSPSAGKGISVSTSNGSISGSPFFRNTTVTDSVNGPSQVVFSEVEMTLSLQPNASFPVGASGGDRKLMAGHGTDLLPGDITGVEADGGTLRENTDYTKASSASVDITLKQSWLDTLSPGRHRVTVRISSEVYGTHAPYIDIFVVDVPKTGDSATPYLWAGLALLAGMGLIVQRKWRRRFAKRSS